MKLSTCLLARVLPAVRYGSTSRATRQNQWFQSRLASSIPEQVAEAYSPDRGLKMDVFDLGVRLGQVIRNEDETLFAEVEKLRKLSRQGRTKEGGIIKQEDALSEMSQMVKGYNAQVPNPINSIVNILIIVLCMLLCRRHYLGSAKHSPSFLHCPMPRKIIIACAVYESVY